MATESSSRDSYNEEDSAEETHEQDVGSTDIVGPLEESLAHETGGKKSSSVSNSTIAKRASSHLRTLASCHQLDVKGKNAPITMRLARICSCPCLLAASHSYLSGSSKFDWERTQETPADWRPGSELALTPRQMSSWRRLYYALVYLDETYSGSSFSITTEESIAWDPQLDNWVLWNRDRVLNNHAYGVDFSQDVCAFCMISSW